MYEFIIYTFITKPLTLNLLIKSREIISTHFQRKNNVLVGLLPSVE